MTATIAADGVWVVRCRRSIGLVTVTDQIDGTEAEARETFDRELATDRPKETRHVELVRPDGSVEAAQRIPSAAAARRDLLGQGQITSRQGRRKYPRMG